MKMVKRAGRGHDEHGVNRTMPGELALRCPACSIPGINIPNGWENADTDDK
jgi:hypothetical protein